jgi:hypothetical protein
VATPDNKAEDLDFERAEFDANQKQEAAAVETEQAQEPEEQSGPLVCRSCQRGIVADYFKANDVAFCPRCHDEIQRQAAQGTQGAMLRAALFGFGGALLGAALYYFIMVVAEIELGIIAIVVGILVGKGVRRGAGLHRHWFYPAVGIALSYLAIVSTYVPDVLDAMNAQTLAPLEEGGSADPPLSPELNGRTLAVAFLAALFVPVLRLVNFELMGPIILAISLWEGWRYARAPKVEFSGPFRQGAV